MQRIPNHMLTAIATVLSGISSNQQTQLIGQLTAASKLFLQLPAWTTQSDCATQLKQFNDWARKVGVFDRKFAQDVRKFVRSLPKERQPKNEVPTGTFMSPEQVDAVQAAFDQALNGIPGLVDHDAVARIEFAADFAASIAKGVGLEIGTAMRHKLAETAQMAKVNLIASVQVALAKVDVAIKQMGNGHGADAPLDLAGKLGKAGDGGSAGDRAQAAD
jgi:hypothetical protein